MHNYRLYGLNIASSHSVSLLAEAVFDQIDLDVDWNPNGYDPERAPGEFVPVRTDMLDLMDEVDLFELEDESGVTTKVDINVDETRRLTFILDSTGNQLDIYTNNDVSRHDLESYFVGPIMSFVLRLRGSVCLHASSVGVNGKAIAFVGHSTAGKSTTAAGMARAGAGILADDISALTETDTGFLVQPGYTRVRLRPIAADFLTPDPDALQRVYTYRDSFYYAMHDSGRFESEALPLAAIYLLGEISDKYKEPFVKAVSKQDKLIRLIENASGIYAVRGRRRADEFVTLSKLAKTVRMRKLYYAHDMTTLPRQCEIILDDFAKLTNVSAI